MTTGILTFKDERFAFFKKTEKQKSKHEQGSYNFVLKLRTMALRKSSLLILFQL